MDDNKHISSIFGPVPSRRLGRSLGIDVIPPKTCSYDCVYCESGPTTHLTLERQAFVPPEQVMRDLTAYFDEHPAGADVLTFSSAGEPTLYEPLGELIQEIKRHFQALPLVVLTNGSLLWNTAVRQALVPADRVVPSLDAVTEAVFRDLNRPHPTLEPSQVIEGLKAFRRDYRGQFHLEVMLVAGLNNAPHELAAVRGVIELLHPDRVELNTVVRPPASPNCRGLSSLEMEAVRGLFPPDTTEIIGHFKGYHGLQSDPGLAERVLNLVRRRPCAVDEMAAALGVALDALQHILLGLMARDRITRQVFDGLEYICPKGKDSDPTSLDSPPRFAAGPRR